MHIGHLIEENQQHIVFYLKHTFLKNEEICCITDEGTMAKNGWENNDSDFLRALYGVYKIRAILFPYLLVNFFKKGISVLLKVINS